MIREMRLVQLAHGGLGFERTWTRPEFFALTIRNGREVTGAPGTGELKPDAPADFTVLDLDRLDRDAIMPVDPWNFFSRAATPRSCAMSSSMAAPSCAMASPPELV